MRFAFGGVAALVLATRLLALSDACFRTQRVLEASDFSQCADIDGFVANVLATQFSVVDPMNTWLTELCGTSCSAASIRNASEIVATGCSSDLNAGIQNAIGLSAIVGNYTRTRSALCTQSKANSTFCITNLFKNIEATAGTALTWIELERFALSWSKIPNSVLCTDCTHAIISNLAPLAPGLASNVTARCGPTFADGKVPETVAVKVKLDSLPFSGQKRGRGWADWTLAGLGLIAGWYCYN